jgi:hypothetical protein
MRAVPPLLLLLAACDGGGNQQTVAPPAEADNRVACALHGSSEFKRDCVVERAKGAEGLMLTIRAPDGGFRRFRVIDDGRGVIAADGAQPALVTIIGGDVIEVAIADDRYRLPATVK